MQILTNISQKVTDRENITFANNGLLHWHIYIWPWPILKVKVKVKVKVIHILIVNISQTVIDKANIAIANNYKVAYRVSIGRPKFVFDIGPLVGLYLYLTLAHW